ncbi:hypothetical protein BX661DRAFT_186272 [Kickxella alabastrina]|uniref:uncharacterized protein n=1 Tax=Kickxella alabastrina TaxID=61397 RepID=UPI002220B855|nr:uncharacterized protein BX661DRAFT_186272 [Kickxella alabastrina]KAI7823703.1 hypothetical protein BX661DRAFT_186272 [Kickxella alabastrina]
MWLPQHFHRAIRTVTQFTYMTAAATAATTFKSRHCWLPKHDLLLKELVKRHGARWTIIAAHMNLDLNPSNYKRRWEVLQTNKQGAWTLADDDALAQVIGQLSKRGMTPGFYYGFWEVVAKALNTGRSARDCYWRWNYPLAKTLKNKWSVEERERLVAAVDLITHVSDPLRAVDHANKSESWLVVSAASNKNLPRGFWIQVANVVGTRTAQQCRIEWNVQSVGAGPQTMSVDELKQMVRLVGVHGKKWEFLRMHYFAHLSAYKLMAAYRGWKYASRRLKVDLHTIDPDTMLVGYQGGLTALRPTGPDGLYDPNGNICEVTGLSPETPLTPFYLALARILPGKPKWPWRATFKRRPMFIPRAFSQNTSLQRLHATGVIERMVALIYRHNGDLRAVSKQMGMPLHRCHRLAEKLKRVLPSLLERK